jgi:predicted RNase H-like HicB family nuclease
MKRKIVDAIIEQASDGNYSIYMDDDDMSYLVTGTGKTVEEAMECFMDGYNDMKKYYTEVGKPFEECEFEFVEDLEE